MIDYFRISTSMGILSRESEEKLHFLTEVEKKELDAIGYTGKTTDGRELTQQEYLNSLNKGEFQFNLIRQGLGDFSADYNIIRVTSDESTADGYNAGYQAAYDTILNAARELIVANLVGSKEQAVYTAINTEFATKSYFRNVDKFLTI